MEPYNNQGGGGGGGVDERGEENSNEPVGMGKRKIGPHLGNEAGAFRLCK